MSHVTDDAIDARVLPHNLDAERALLGAVLLQPDALSVVDLPAEAFYREAHRRIYRAMRRLAERSAAIDLTTLREELGRVNDLDEIGGPAQLAALVDGVARSTNVEDYARIIRSKARLREIIQTSSKL